MMTKTSIAAVAVAKALRDALDDRTDGTPLTLEQAHDIAVKASKEALIENGSHREDDLDLDRAALVEAQAQFGYTVELVAGQFVGFTVGEMIADIKECLDDPNIRRRNVVDLAGLLDKRSGNMLFDAYYLTCDMTNDLREACGSGHRTPHQLRRLAIMERASQMMQLVLKSIIEIADFQTKPFSGQVWSRSMSEKIWGRALD